MAVYFNEQNLARVRTANKADEKGLCVGFATWDYSKYPDAVTETLYAVTPAGVLTSTHKATNEFDRSGRKWIAYAGTVPADAEFIGCYKVPTCK